MSLSGSLLTMPLVPLVAIALLTGCPVVLGCDGNAVLVALGAALTPALAVLRWCCIGGLVVLTGCLT